MWKDVVELFRNYMGTGLIVIWFLLSLVFLYVTEKRKHIRVFFVYVPVLLLLIYFNPLVAELVYRVAGNEIYYRILWLVPMTPVIAYSCVCICGRLRQEGRKRTAAGAAVGTAVLLCFSGSFIYSNPYFSRAENVYHVPDSVVHICDAISIPGREVMAVFPKELVQYVRQYTALMRMPYGREITVERWNFYSELYDAMEADVIVLEELEPAVWQAQCHYVVLPSDKEVRGEFADYKWELYCETDGYSVYRVTEYPLVYWE